MYIFSATQGYFYTLSKLCYVIIDQSHMLISTGNIRFDKPLDTSTHIHTRVIWTLGTCGLLLKKYWADIIKKSQLFHRWLGEIITLPGQFKSL